MQQNGTTEKKIVRSNHNNFTNKVFASYIVVKRWLFLNSKEKTNDNYLRLPHQRYVERMETKCDHCHKHIPGNQTFFFFVCVYVSRFVFLLFLNFSRKRVRMLTLNSHWTISNNKETKHCLPFDENHDKRVMC